MLVDYAYQFQFELCSLIFLLCLMVHYASAKRFPTITNNLFSIILLCAFLDLSLDIAGCLTLEHITTVPVWVNYLVNGLFYCLQTILPLLMCVYVIFAMGFSFFRNKALFLVFAPAALFLGIQLINPFTGLVFSIGTERGELGFIQGPLHILLYASVIIYLVILLALVFLNREKLTKKQVLTILFFTAIVTVAMAFQIKHPDIILTGTGITVAIMLWDLTLQSPETMLDEDTGAFNSSALHLFLDGELGRRQVHSVVVNVDGLSSLDRGSGNLASKTLAREVGEYFESIRGKKSWLFRDSKARFWIITRTRAELEQVSSVIATRFKGNWDVAGISVDLTAKVLVASTNTHSKISSAELVSIINDALNAENVINNHRIRLDIDSSLLAKYRRQQIIDESMRRSVKTGEGLYVCFQPLVPAKKMKVNAAEVLLRFNDPNLGAVSPTEFIPVIEKRGLALFIDTFVVEEACAFLCAHPEIDMLHVNLSATEFFHNPVSRITEIVKRYNVNPKKICFEITESSAAKNPEFLNSFMKQMIELGYSFALDDYGTGYSNALQVLSLPFRVVKLDKILLEEGQKSRRFLEGTLRMFSDLGLVTVVEGIETKEQYDMVVSMGTLWMQGYLFSPPLPEKEYLAYIDRESKDAE